MERTLGDPRDALLRRPQLGQDVARGSRRGVAWTVAGQAASFAVQLGTLLVLARLLTPEAFGLVAMASVPTLFAAQFVGLGLDHATVQARSLTHAQVSALFWLSCGAAAALSALLVLLAPAVASFYGRDELVPVLQVLSVTFVLGALGVQHQAVLVRLRRFEQVAARQLLARLGGAAAAVTLAALGAGHWALVAGQVVSAAVTTAVLWACSPWRPGRPVRGTPVRGLLSSAGGLSVFGLLHFAAKNADNVLIGRFLGAEQLGLYTRAYGLFLLPLQQVAHPVGTVAASTLCALAGEPARFRRYYLAAVRALASVGMPLVVFLAVMAPEVVHVALGAEWAQVADVFRWLAIAGIPNIVTVTNGWLYLASGQTWRQARHAAWSRPLVIGSFVVGLPWGIEGVAAAFALTQLALVPSACSSALARTPVSRRDLLAACRGPVGLAVAVGGACLAVRVLLPATHPVLLLLAAAAAAAAVTGALLAAWPEARRDLAVLRDRRPLRTGAHVHVHGE